MVRKSEDLLSGWQEIAQYLDVSVRTVQRWKRSKGLPVRHPAGVGSTPHASRKSMDDWAFRGTEQGLVGAENTSRGDLGASGEPNPSLQAG